MNNNQHPLPAFNGRLNLINALLWPHSEILKWIYTVAVNPRDFMSPYHVVPNSASAASIKTYGEKIKNIQLACELFLQLCSPPADGNTIQWPTGSPYRPEVGMEFGNAKAPPNQHILRNNQGQGNVVARPQLALLKGPLWDLAPPQYYWNPFDLLGLIFSLLGPAPDNATHQNFFQPLTALYGVWCSKIGSNVLNGSHDNEGVQGVGDLPEIFQLTSRMEQPLGQPGVVVNHYFLGASIGGYSGKDDQREFAQSIKRHRFLLLQNVNMIPNGIQWPQGGNVLKFYGNCAETYPFVNLFQGLFPGEGHVTAFGMAFAKSLIEGFDPNQPYDPNWLRKHHRSACNDCCNILDHVQVEKLNFN